MNRIKLISLVIAINIAVVDLLIAQCEYTTNAWSQSYTEF